MHASANRDPYRVLSSLFQLVLLLLPFLFIFICSVSASSDPNLAFPSPPPPSPPTKSLPPLPMLFNNIDLHSTIGQLEPTIPNYCNNSKLLEQSGLIRAPMGQFLGFPCSNEFYHCRWQSDGYRTYRKNCRAGLVYDVMGTQNCNYDYNVKGCSMNPTGIAANCTNRDFECPLSEDCVPLSKRCDGNYDCLLEEDEQNCPMCKPTHFPCVISEQCIPLGQRCNGIKECQDGTDELDCENCGSGKFFCRKSGKCISGKDRCDGFSQCPNGEDEQLCKKTRVLLGPRMFLCESGKHQIPQQNVCDGIVHCPDDASDEKYCQRATNAPAIEFEVQSPPPLPSPPTQPTVTAAEIGKMEQQELEKVPVFDQLQPSTATTPRQNINLIGDKQRDHQKEKQQEESQRKVPAPEFGHQQGTEPRMQMQMGEQRIQQQMQAGEQRIQQQMPPSRDQQKQVQKTTNEKPQQNFVPLATANRPLVASFPRVNFNPILMSPPAVVAPNLKTAPNNGGVKIDAGHRQGAIPPTPPTMVIRMGSPEKKVGFGPTATKMMDQIPPMQFQKMPQQQTPRKYSTDLIQAAEPMLPPPRTFIPGDFQAGVWNGSAYPASQANPYAEDWLTQVGQQQAEQNNLVLEQEAGEGTGAAENNRPSEQQQLWSPSSSLPQNFLGSQHILQNTAQPPGQYEQRRAIKDGLHEARGPGNANVEKNGNEKLLALESKEVGEVKECEVGIDVDTEQGTKGADISSGQQPTPGTKMDGNMGIGVANVMPKTEANLTVQTTDGENDVGNAASETEQQTRQQDQQQIGMTDATGMAEEKRDEEGEGGGGRAMGPMIDDRKGDEGEGEEELEQRQILRRLYNKFGANAKDLLRRLENLLLLAENGIMAQNGNGTNKSMDVRSQRQIAALTQKQQQIARRRYVRHREMVRQYVAAVLGREIGKGEEEDRKRKEPTKDVRGDS